MNRFVPGFVAKNWPAPISRRPSSLITSSRPVGTKLKLPCLWVLVQELMLQYQGGVGAFVTGAATYGIDLDELARTAWDAIPADIMAETLSFVEWYDKQGGKTHHGLTHEARVVCDAIKTMWRKQHPAISSLWPELEATMKDAIGNPGVTMPCRRFNIRCDGAWLRVGLPSGRALCYPQPGLVAGKVTFMGVNPYTKQWARLSTYGGKVFENACQSLAGDVLKSSMPAMDAAGYEINLTVHDEAVTETPDTDLFSAAGLAAIMSTVPSWATGLPLAAAGFECYRYRKE